MKADQYKKFSWCPVCMVHTYHRRQGGQWKCLEKDHALFLKYRTDPYIEKFRRSQKKQAVSANQEV
jgi:hypothetical protein